VEVGRVVRRFGPVTALDGVSLTVSPGEFFSLLGPSGCGKTTLLRILAGLDWPDAGQVRLGGRNALALPAHRRPVNTVFQSYALFPHLTVSGNIAFGLQMKRVPAPAIARRVAAAMALAQITDLATRRPAELSGGQKQRVALARALVNEPEVLLLDEPLGALDLQLRRQLQTELKSVQRRLGITFIHVTHDQEEALALSDRLAVLRAGRVEQVGTPQAVYEQPRTRFVAEFLGACNLIAATPAATLTATPPRLDSAFGPLELPPATSLPGRNPLTLAIRPERVGLAGPGSTLTPQPATNVVRGTVRDILYAGPETQYTVETGGQVLRVRVPSRADGARGWGPGDEVAVHLPPAALTVLED
jgi:spermidine/putrescine transport system ATP-binding protein